MTFTQQQQALVIERRGVDGFFLRPRVICRHQYVEGFIVELHGQHISLIERQGDNDCVQLTVAQLVAQHVGEVLFDVQRHLRGNPVQLRNQVREQVGTHGVDRAYFKRCGQLVLASLRQFPNPLSLLKNLLRLRDDAFTHRGKTHGTLAALENKHTKFIFKLFHAHR